MYWLKALSFSAILGLLQAPALGWTTIDLMSAISCNADLNREFYFQQLTKYYGAAVKTEGGAHWFKGKDSIYGATVRDVFVSAEPPYNYVGVVLESSPKEVAEGIKTARFASANMYFQEHNNTWVGSDGRKMVWHEEKYAKIFCFGMRSGR